MDKRLKILVFDGISNVFLGHQIYEAFGNIGVEAQYVDPSAFSSKMFFKIRRAWNRKMDKVFRGNAYSGFPRLTKRAEALMSEKIITFFPDIILVVGLSDAHVRSDFFGKIQEKLKCKLVLFDTESGNFFSSRNKLIYFINHETKKYDNVLSFSREVVEYLNGLGIPAEYFHFGFKQAEGEISPCVTEKDVCFVGGANIRRLFILEKIKHHNLVVYGKSWQKYKSIMSKELIEKTIFKDIHGEELSKVLRSSKIVLNITNADFFGIYSGINLRPFEAASHGCFMLTDYTNELAALFEIGQEIEAYKSQEELTEKINYYLSNESARLNIAKQGYLKYKEKYTWEKRAEYFLSIMTRSNLS